MSEENEEIVNAEFEEVEEKQQEEAVLLNKLVIEWNKKSDDFWRVKDWIEFLSKLNPEKRLDVLVKDWSSGNAKPFYLNQRNFDYRKRFNDDDEYMYLIDVDID